MCIYHYRCICMYLRVYVLSYYIHTLAVSMCRLIHGKRVVARMPILDFHYKAHLLILVSLECEKWTKYICKTKKAMCHTHTYIRTVTLSGYLGKCSFEGLCFFVFFFFEVGVGNKL